MTSFDIFCRFLSYVNAYVLYLILFKGSWHYIDASAISDNISH